MRRDNLLFVAPPAAYAVAMTLHDPEPLKSDGHFLRRLLVVTLSVLLVVLVIHLLKELASILQPLLIAALIAYATLPPHRWLVKRGVRPALSYALLLFLLLASIVFAGQAVISSVTALTDNPQRLNSYRERLTGLQRGTARLLENAGVADAEGRMQRAGSEFTASTEDVLGGIRRAASGFVGFLTFALTAFVYLVFLLVEKISFDRRMSLAFGDAHAGRIAQLALSINEAIVNYIAVKAWISLVTAVMSLAVFLIFGIDFAFFWALLIFLLNFIPYIGGLAAMAPPVALGFLQHESIWPGVLIIAGLTAIQLLTGQVLEPRIAGKRLNLSPLLILLSLAFWGWLWSVPGVLLAVPLTVVIKIVLDHIPETRPIATLMSNV